MRARHAGACAHVNVAATCDIASSRRRRAVPARAGGRCRPGGRLHRAALHPHAPGATGPCRPAGRAKVLRLASLAQDDRVGSAAGRARRGGRGRARRGEVWPVERAAGEHAGAAPKKEGVRGALKRDPGGCGAPSLRSEASSVAKKPEVCRSNTGFPARSGPLEGPSGPSRGLLGASKTQCIYALRTFLQPNSAQTAAPARHSLPGGRWQGPRSVRLLITQGYSSLGSSVVMSKTTSTSIVEYSGASSVSSIL